MLLFICALLTIVSVILNMKTLVTQTEDVHHNAFIHKVQSNLKESDDSPTAPPDSHQDSRNSDQSDQEKEKEQQKPELKSNSEPAAIKGGFRVKNGESEANAGGSHMDSQAAKSTVDEERQQLLLQQQQEQQSATEQKHHAERMKHEVAVFEHFEQLYGQNCRPSGELAHYPGMSTAKARKLCLQRAECECVACDMDSVRACSIFRRHYFVCIVANASICVRVCICCRSRWDASW